MAHPKKEEEEETGKKKMRKVWYKKEKEENMKWKEGREGSKNIKAVRDPRDDPFPIYATDK